MTKTAKSILRNLTNTVEWCVEPQLLSRATIDRQREQVALDQALKELLALIRTEKLKLLAEVRERVQVNQKGQFEEDSTGTVCWYLDDLVEALKELEAEL